MASGGGAGERQGAEQIRLFAHGGGHTYFRTLTGWPRAAYWTAALSAARRTLVASISIASESSKKIVYKNLFCYTFAPACVWAADTSSWREQCFGHGFIIFHELRIFGLIG